MKKWLVIIIVLCAFLAWGCWFMKHRTTPATVVFRSAVIGRATITQDVSATGTIKPIHEVEIGTQVTGTILKLHVDYNSIVKAGQIVAEIDPATYQATYDAAIAQENSARASRQSAEAQLATAQAAQKMTEVKYAYTKKELARQQALHERKMLTDSDFDATLSTCEQLAAQLESNDADIAKAKADIAKAEADVMQREASSRQAKANLDYCTISSPVNGIVISRDVDEGQTVVSNMSASTLLTIAEDLSRIQVEAGVPEADIGQVRRGQKVIFTVDTYRDSFVGTVKDIRLDAQSESNVVTYPVIVEADNPDEKLFPGMTANLSLIVMEKIDVVSVPAAALRFKGPDLAGAPLSAVDDGQQGHASPIAPHDEPGQGAPLAGPDQHAPVPSVNEKIIWLGAADGSLRPRVVVLGVTDGVNQELCDADDLVGQKVIIGKLSGSAAAGNDNSTTNPFVMKPPSGAPPR